MTNNFNNLNWIQSQLKMQNGKMMQATKDGKFTREGIVKELQRVSNNFDKRGSSGQIGVAMHYKEMYDWVPGMFTKFGESENIFEVKDSPSMQKFIGDEIDAVQFYVIRTDVKTDLDLANKKPVSHLKPKKIKKAKVSDWF